MIKINVHNEKKIAGEDPFLFFLSPAKKRSDREDKEIITTPSSSSTITPNNLLVPCYKGLVQQLENLGYIQPDIL